MNFPSTKPYLIRALHQWCTDHGFTPYLTVWVDERTRVPHEFVRDGQIVLNVGYEATGHLEMANDWISFQARFSGVARDIALPVANVLSIHARENGVGMSFDLEEVEADGKDAGDGPEPTPPPPVGRARLQRIK